MARFTLEIEVADRDAERVRKASEFLLADEQPKGKSLLRWLASFAVGARITEDLDG